MRITGAEVTIKLPLEMAVSVKQAVQEKRDALVNQLNLLHITEDEKNANRKEIARLSDALLRF